MFPRKRLIFWIAIALILTLIFGQSFGSLVLGFFFVSFLFPVIIGTTMFFNMYLVPNFLLKDRTLLFVLYSIYMLICSVYLEMLVMTIAFVVLANYEVENLGTMAGDIYALTTILYTVVLADGFVRIVRSLKIREQEIQELKLEKSKRRISTILIKVNRQNVKLKVDSIAMVESRSDYVRIISDGDEYTSKEKISVMEQSLPNHFVRIHRSFLVNQDHIKSFNHDSVQVGDQSIPIGRKYKNASMERLKEQTGWRT